MITYPKIDTLFTRNSRFKVNFGDYRRPEFPQISHWLVTEKVDGTNVRLNFGVQGHTFAGRTDKAQFTPEQTRYLAALCSSLEHGVQHIIREHGLESLTIFGEFYGPKIQAGGNYSTALGFKAFDMLVNDRIWLSHPDVTSNAKILGLDTVPTLGVMSLLDIISKVENGFVSTFSLNRDYEAEGVVAKTAFPLYDNRGNRVMWKLKSRDFA